MQRNGKRRKLGILPHLRGPNILPSTTGLLKYSACCACVDIFDSARSISSSVFFSGHVLRPSASRMFTMSWWSAIAPARTMQQSSAMMLPQKTTSSEPEGSRVG